MSVVCACMHKRARVFPVSLPTAKHPVSATQSEMKRIWSISDSSSFDMLDAEDLTYSGICVV